MVLGKRGMRRVHLVEAQDDMGGIMRWIPQLPGLGEWARVVNYRKIQIDKLKNVEFIPNTKLEEGRVLASHVYDDEAHEHEFEADAVVLVTQRRSNEALYRNLKDEIGADALGAEGITGFFRIGDCEAPRLVADCIFSGHRLAREIDSENPEVPLPFKRERRVIEREAVAV